MNTLERPLKRYLVCFLMFVLFGTRVLAVDSDLPQMGIDASGNIIAVWQTYDTNGNYYVQTASHPLGGSWSAPVTLSPSGQYATNPVIAVDGLGNAVAIWGAVDPTTGNTLLYGAMLTVGNSLITATWTSAVQIAASSNNVLNGYSVNINDGLVAKNVVAMWSAYDSVGMNRGVYASTALLGGSWSTPVRVSGS